MENIAIVTVAYNRVKSLSRLLNSLLCADIDNAPLIISIDKSNTNEVERYANDFIWPYGEKKKKVITHKENLGLRKHILSIGQLLDYYDAVIVLEDDIIVAPGFFINLQLLLPNFIVMIIILLEYLYITIHLTIKLLNLLML